MALPSHGGKPGPLAFLCSPWVSRCTCLCLCRVQKEAQRPPASKDKVFTPLLAIAVLKDGPSMSLGLQYFLPRPFPAPGKLLWASCGHPPGYLVGAFLPRRLSPWPGPLYIHLHRHGGCASSTIGIQLSSETWGTPLEGRTENSE